MEKLIGWIGTATSIVGSFAVASKFFLLGYCLFLVGSVSWLYLGIKRKDTALSVLNATFLCANLLGLWNSFS
jgi:uncharacterized membrane protein